MRLGISLSLTQQVSGFSPASLFSGGQQGAWYDPSDVNMLFQDSAGTTPVTAAGQPVGLVLDKSRGLVLGPELVTNGDFSAGSTGWTIIGTGWSIASGLLSGSGVPANDYGPYQNATSVVAGVTYKATYTITVATGGVAVRVGNTQSSTYTSSGTYTQYFVATSTGVTVFQARAGGSGFTGTIDNISVRELAGNHATQTTAASRPTYGVVPATGRRNLLVNTPFAGAVAGSPGAIPTSWTLDINNASIATPSADVIEISAVAQRTVFRQSFSVAAAEVRTFSCNVEVVSGTIVFNQIFDMTIFAGPTYTYFMDGAPVTSTTTIPVGSHVLQVTVVNDATLRTIGARIGVGVVSNSTAVVRYNEPQFEAGSTPTAYQRVTTAFNVTEAGVQSLSYLSFDGVDDFLVTPTITPNIDKVQVFAGVRKLSDAAFGIVAEVSADVNSNSGSFNLSASPTNVTRATYGLASRGSILVSFQSPATFAAPISNVLTGLGDISGDRATLRINGSQVAQSTADQGTGNYLAYPIFIGRRAGTSLPFNGQLYGLIVRFGANLDAATISATERWMGSETGVTIA